MAKIEMDITEYDALRENKKLLENALEKERELQNKITSLNEEKLKVLKDAAMSVTQITVTKRHEYIKVKNRPEEIWKYFCRKMGIDQYKVLPKLGHIALEEMADLFFDIESSESPQKETVVTKGLDDVRSEIRREEISKIDKDTQRRLEAAEKAIYNRSILLSEIEDIKNREKRVCEENEALRDTLEELSDKKSNLEDLVGNKQKVIIELNSKIDEEYKKTSLELEHIYEIKKIVKHGYGFFNKSSMLDKIIYKLKDVKV